MNKYILGSFCGFPSKLNAFILVQKCLRALYPTQMLVTYTCIPVIADDMCYERVQLQTNFSFQIWSHSQYNRDKRVLRKVIAAFYIDIS